VSKSCLTVRNLGKNFGSKNALTGITLDVKEDEIIGLVGPNGAGKTTLIKLIMGLLKPDTGSVSLYGKDIKAVGHDEMRRVGYIPDEPFFYDFMTARQTIEFNRRFYPNWDSQKCDDLLQRFHLPLDEPVKNMSRGMKAQLGLILVLAQKADFLVLDEPLEGLDPLRRLEFLNLVLEDFLESAGRSVLISSHYLEELERVVDRVAFLHEGRLLRVMDIEQLKMEEKTIRVVFQKEPPETLLNMSGIKSVQQEGKTSYLLTMEDNFNAIYEACSRYPHFILEIYHRNLEDVFMDFSGRDNDDHK